VIALEKIKYDNSEILNTKMNVLDQTSGCFNFIACFFHSGLSKFRHS